jgi:integrase
VSDICKQSELPIEKCAYGSKHKYKGIVYLENNARATKTFGRNYNEAVEGVAKLRITVKENTPETMPAIMAREPPEQESKLDDSRTYSLAALMARYVSYLCGDETIPIHKRKQRSKGHIQDCERTFLRFATAAIRIKRNMKTLRIDKVDDELIGAFYSELTEADKLNLGNAGFNRAITIMSSFYEYLKESEGYVIGNPFSVVVRKPTHSKIETIQSQQFAALLEGVGKPELGIRTLSDGTKKNYYKPFLKDALELFLYSGRRRTEVVRIKWKDIFYEEDKAKYIAVPDYKYNRKNDLPKKDWKYNYVPVTEELTVLLERLGEKENRHCDKYILAPDEVMQRDTMASLLSKAFSHYAEQIGIDLSLGALRRTNFSSLSAEIGIENAQTISGHGGLAVMRKYYVSQRVLAKAAKEFKVFKDDKQTPRQNAQDASREEENDFSKER